MSAPVVSTDAIAMALSALRNQHGGTDAEFERAHGVAVGTLCHFDKGRGGLNPKLAEALGVRKVTAYEVVDLKRFNSLRGRR